MPSRLRHRADAPTPFEHLQAFFMRLRLWHLERALVALERERTILERATRTAIVARAGLALQLATSAPGARSSALPTASVRVLRPAGSVRRLANG